MAVLKRFSYDNIVEHNPTAPDPVDYDGGGEGGGGSDNMYLVTFTEDNATGTYSCDKSLSDITAAYNEGKYIWGKSVLRIGDTIEPTNPVLTFVELYEQMAVFSVVSANSTGASIINFTRTTEGVDVLYKQVAGE